MKKEIIKSSQAPQPIGPYNQAIKVNNFVFVSGQIPLDLKTNQILPSNVNEQTRLVITHLGAVLKEAGSSLEKIVKVTVFLKNMNDFPSMNAVYSEFFKSESAPARSTIEVARLPKDALVEIEAIATVG